MKRASKTFTATIEYDEYEPGDTVLMDGKEYTVERFFAPMNAGDPPILHLVGYQYGVSDEMVQFVRRQ